MMTSAIIVAAGSSRRMGFDKVFAKLAGKPVIAHSITAFEKCPQIGEIIIVTRENRIEEMRKLVKAGKFAKVSKIIPGGAERHLSVWNGLLVLDEEAQYVAIHDGARPLTTPGLVTKCIQLAAKKGAACAASPVGDTVKRASDHVVGESVERDGLWAMQTPQVFRKDVILQAYAGIMQRNESVTDEVSAVQRSGREIALLQNQDWNIKITFPRDLEMAEMVLKSRGKKSASKS
jgi:2-C-methyl-D-erythritol 4-phosphate cytidylyltransferase